MIDNKEICEELNELKKEIKKMIVIVTEIYEKISQNDYRVDLAGSKNEI
jgi:hypothetical protein